MLSYVQYIKQCPHVCYYTKEEERGRGWFLLKFNVVVEIIVGEIINPRIKRGGEAPGGIGRSGPRAEAPAGEGRRPTSRNSGLGASKKVTPA